MKEPAIFNNEIRNVEDVIQYFSYLVNEMKLNLHPDTDFSEYVSFETGQNTFTDEQISHFNNLMKNCFKACEFAEADIYEICMGVMKGNMNS